MKRLAVLLIILLCSMAPAASRAGVFPVTIEHAFGETTVPAQPERIVSIGLVEQDFLYALGLSPVGVRNWWGDHPYATWPWAEAARRSLGAEPAVMPGEELNLEWVLAQNPDLIVAEFTDIDESQYEALSKIAPVVARPQGYPAWGAPWQDELRLIDQATSGGTEKADAIVAELDAKVAAVRVAHTEFVGKTATNVYFNDGSFGAWGPEDTASRFLLSLGFVFPTGLGAGDADNHIVISPENLRLLDLDVVVWPIDLGDNATQSSVEAMPLYKNLRLAKEGRSLWLDDGQGTFSGALSFQSPLSIEFLLDQLPPLLAAAVDGDPQTSPKIEVLP